MMNNDTKTNSVIKLSECLIQTLNKRYQSIKLDGDKTWKLFNNEYNIDIIQIYVCTSYPQGYGSYKLSCPLDPRLEQQYTYKQSQLFLSLNLDTVIE